jgi:hypothetical protein
MAAPAETCGRERIAAFHCLRVLWLIVIVIGARQASPDCASGPAAIARRQQVVVVEFPLEPGSRVLVFADQERTSHFFILRFLILECPASSRINSCMERASACLDVHIRRWKRWKCRIG